MTKFIVTTGGVLSGLGKGVTSASIGNLLKAQGFKVFALKLDPYLNIDPGVMSPIEHGEVFVTADGGETDLDLGHYERFIDVELSKDSNFTSGRIYQRIFEKERQGLYGGKTVQIVPHVINEIIAVIENLAKSKKPDFILIEIGGTVGDIESNPYIYAISKFASLNPGSVFFNHIAFVPYLTASKEYKSKPTQVSIASLRSFGIMPNLLLLRSQGEINKAIINKAAEASFLAQDHVISVPDKANIYEIPMYLYEQKILDIIYQYFNIKAKIDDKAYQPWKSFLKKYLSERKYKINLLLAGKYSELEDAYLSIISSLKIAAAHQNIDLHFDLMDADKVANSDLKTLTKNYDGVMILPGFGSRGFESKVEIAHFTRDNLIPTLGICFGFQAMVVDQARRVGITKATSKEFAEEFPNWNFVLTPFYENGDKAAIGGTLRLGADKVQAKKGTLAAKIYGEDIFYARHRHRYEVAKEYVDKIEDNNFVFSGLNPSNKNCEICEYKNHPFFLGVQYHPEFSTRVLSSNPLFDNFLKAIIKNKKIKE